MKKLAIGFGILIVILIGAILVVPSFLNWNEYKNQIEKTASGYTGRDVKIKGDISLSLLPMTALSVKDVTVTNLDGGRAEHLLSLKSLDVKVSFPSVISSLFGGKIKVEKFILVDPVIALEVLNDGRLNWDLSGGATDSGDPASSGDISLDKFQIINGQISFEDMTSHQMELIRKINANVRVKSINGPFDISGSARYKGLDAELDLKLGKNRPGKKVPVSLVMSLLDSRLKVNVIGGVIFSGMDSVFAGKLDVTASDAGDIFNLVDRFNGEKRPAVITVGQDFSLDTVVDMTPENMAITDLNIRIGQSRGQGRAEITLGEGIDVQAALSINKLDMDPLLAAYGEQKKNMSGRPAPAIQETGGKKPEIPLLERLSGKFDLKLGALKYNGKIASQIAFKLSAADGAINISTIEARMPGGARLAFTGQVTRPVVNDSPTTTLTGDVSLNASNLRGLLSWIKMDIARIPSGLLTHFSHKSGLKVTPDLLQLYAMDGKLDAMRYKGGVSYALSHRPSYGIRLDLRDINLDSYLAGKGSDAKTDLKTLFAPLDEFDADYDVTLANVTLGGIKIRSGQLKGLLLGGRLDAGTIKLDDASGVNLTASAKGQDFSGKPSFTLTLSAEAKSLATLQRSLKLDDMIDLRKLGRMKLTGSFSSTLEKLDIDLKTSLGVKKLDVKGTVRSATLKHLPDVGSADLEIDARSTSLAALIDQLDLPLTRPMAGDDRAVRLKGRIKASSDLIDIDGRMTIAGGDVIIKGRRKGKGKAANLDLTLDMKAAETREFIRGLGVDFQPSAKKLGAIALKMKVTGAGDRYNFANIVGDVGPVKLSGSGKMNMAPKKPVFDFNLKTGDIPLHDFLKENPENDREYGQWSHQTMDLSLLSAYEGRAQVSAASLRYNGYIFDSPTFETTLKDGVLSVNNFTGRLFGGEVALSGIFNSRGKPEMKLNMTLKGGSLAQATTSSAGIAPVAGFFDMSGQFAARGKSQFDMISSLSGQGDIIASPGLVSGIDIPALSRQLSEMGSDGAFMKLLTTTLSGGETPYKGGQSNMVTKDGKIRFSPFDIELDGAKSTVNMAVDLLNWDIRSDGRLALVDHPAAPPIGFSITGDVSNPDVVFKTDRLKKYVGAKIASNMLQKLIGDEGGLEGIFGNQPQKQPQNQNNLPKTQENTNKPEAAQKPAQKPVEEFGKRLLQKLFEKEKKNQQEKQPEKSEEPNS
ncbi:hypothetical protein MNBD_ALPHA01-1605 [hydrothermal vent metagenome]|uniref:AsmA domain-containing protein n=1 Tax=hydrothermal vent metagenome TaxID=652676 RepID=A0A3B0SC78_9ZZZZ